jgi:hypothetical protein
LEEAKIDGAWLTAYAKIARRCRDDKDLGVSGTIAYGRCSNMRPTI